MLASTKLLTLSAMLLASLVCSPSWAQQPLSVPRAAVSGGDIAWNWSQPASWHAAVCKVEGHRTGNTYRAGSGVVIQHRGCVGVLTARHVLLDGPTATAVLSTGQRVQGRCTHDRYLHDVGWIQLRSPPERITPMQLGQPQIGQVEIHGFGASVARLRHFWAQLDRQDEAWVAVSKVSATYGDSGGPWVQDGLVVGVTSAVGDSRSPGHPRHTPGPDGSPQIIGDFTISAAPHAIHAFLERVCRSQFG